MPRHVLVDAALADRNNEWARRIIRVAMIGRGFTYADLARLLDEAGVHDNERNLRNKVSRGEFSATFMLMCLKVMGIKSIDLDEWSPEQGTLLHNNIRTHFDAPAEKTREGERQTSSKKAIGQWRARATPRAKPG